MIKEKNRVINMLISLSASALSGLSKKMLRKNIRGRKIGINVR